MPEQVKKSRREIIADGVRTCGLVAASGVLGALAVKAGAEEKVWQIDPNKCIFCTRCSTECVLDVSAVKCVHAYALCGYCKLCSGVLRDKRTGNTTLSEDQRCPTNAIRRAYVEDPYFEYFIEEPKCLGCGICAKGCNSFGNGSLFMQVRHDRCVNCNQCAIATVCPAQAFERVPVDKPYLPKVKKG